MFPLIYSTSEVHFGGQSLQENVKIHTVYRKKKNSKYRGFTIFFWSSKLRLTSPASINYLAEIVSHMNTLFSVSYSLFFFFHLCGVISLCFLLSLFFSFRQSRWHMLYVFSSVWGSEMLIIFLFTFSITSEQALRWAT